MRSKNCQSGTIWECDPRIQEVVRERDAMIIYIRILPLPFSSFFSISVNMITHVDFNYICLSIMKVIPSKIL